MANSQLNSTNRVESFRCALSGVSLLITSQRNAWIHVLATCSAVTIGFFLGLTKSEWCWIIAAIFWVWTIEALNTAIEFLTDLASPQFDPLAGRVKDIAAGAVLIASIGAALIGLLILGPYVIPLFA